MKFFELLIIFIIIFYSSNCPVTAHAEILGKGLTLPPDDPAFDNTQLTFTEEEMADPPVGEIRKRYLRDLNEVRAMLADSLAAAPAGPEGQQSPWMAKFQAIKAKLDQIAATRLQSDVIDLIPKMREIFEGGGATTGYPEFFRAPANSLLVLGICIVETLSENIVDQAANVKASDLANFVIVFSVDGFVRTADWESDVMPIDPAGIMIMDPAAVVNQLQNMPWRYAGNFLNRLSSIDAFKDYEPAGEGLAVLKNKYITNKAQAVAKWQELTAWVVQRRPADVK